MRDRLVSKSVFNRQMPTFRKKQKERNIKKQKYYSFVLMMVLRASRELMIHSTCANDFSENSIVKSFIYSFSIATNEEAF